MDEHRGRAVTTVVFDVDPRPREIASLHRPVHGTRRTARRVHAVHVALISTYELGHQPLHLASPAAALEAAGHEVSVVDTAVDALVVAESWDVAAISVPMHTARRLAAEVVEALRAARPDLPVALYGLYAGEGADDRIAARFVGEYEPLLVEWADGGGDRSGTRVSIANGRFVPPVRSGLPDPARYGRLRMGGGERVAGYVEASHGCRHRCRHCPIPAVYDGRYRIVDRDVVLADVESQVAAGVEHITWGDPDFLNGPRHAVSVLEAAHERFPDVTHDLTIKVEHLRLHDDLLPRLAEAGTVFIVSAFETTDDRTLELLGKGHTASDMSVVVERARAVGIDIHPSWMPFVPWTRPSDVVGIFEFLAAHDLLGSTDPVQMSIRLLIPRDSLMLGLEEVASVVDGYDEASLSYRWRSVDPRSDELQRLLAGRAEAAVGLAGDNVDVVVEMWGDALEAAGRRRQEAALPDRITRDRPQLTESWFCCAEPTTAQTAALRIDVPLGG